MGKCVINQQEVSWADVFDALDRGVSVVTGNTRLAGAIRHAFEQRAIGQGLEVWFTPDVLPWSAWLQRCWEQAVVSGGVSAPALLLTPQQELRVWEDIIAASSAGQPLQQLVGAARRAQDARQLLQSWRLSLDEAVFRYNDDSAAFWQWASRFESMCTEKGWLPIARLADELHRSLLASEWMPSTGLALIGFDELAPQQQSLLQALVETGCDVRWLQLQGKESQTAMIGCVDARQEAATVARWVRQRLDENADAQIGVVVPELASQREIVIHALDEILVPHALQPGQQSVVRPYNISLGLPLSVYPIINTALKLLGLLERVISLEDAGRLLRSPFIAGWEQEISARALLDGRLRETGELKVSLGTLRYHASRTTRSYACPVFAENLGAWIKAARDYPRTGSPGQWSERFSRLLKAIGWAGGRTLSSEEYQAAEAWRELLGAFSALEPVTAVMTASAAVAQLRRMAAERTFQPQTGAAAVQVLGMFEAIGLQFDYLWVMGLHDGAWPTPPRPNPFIPLRLQRDAGLPRASEERELHVARTITDRLLTSATEVIVSFPRRHGEEELRPSPLIADLPVLNQEDLRLWSVPTWRDDVHRSARLTVLEQDPAPPIENEEVPGGSAVFKLQAACPFRAFAELRLGARPLGRADIGLDARTRGLLMHRVLEKVWDALESHERLVAMESAQLGGLVENIVGGAIDEIANRYPQTFIGRFRSMEAERLCRQVLQWLALEKQRVPFRVVEREGKHEASAGGIRVRLKVDRIDELADGRQVVIDYKTGEVKPSQWFGERPDEPQLPLYSMAVEGDIAGVLFAQLKAGAMTFKGVVAESGMIPGVKSYDSLKPLRDLNSWSDVLSDWRATMERLGAAFRSGEAAVDPKQYPHTCAYCELTPLCRINELTVLDEEPCDAGGQS